MKLILSLFVSCFCLITYAQNQERPTKPIDLVQSFQAKSSIFETIAPFETATQKKTLVSELNQEVVDYDVLIVNQAFLKAYSGNAPETITLNIPSESKNKTYQLDLIRVDLFTADFVVTLGSTGQPTTVKRGIHYRGIIKGDPNSIASISIFDQEVMGLIASDEGNMVLGKLAGKEWKGEHIFYDDRAVLSALPFDCAMPDDGIGYKQEELEFDAANKAIGDCIRLYLEVDHNIHNNKGGVTGATNYVTGLLNEVITLYANENISAIISEIVVWDVPSPYSSGSSSGMLNDFQAFTGSFNGDLAQLLSYQASGGIAASFSGICNPNPDNSKSFSSIHSSYASVPTYSWSVMVVTHEFGHLWGSRHTHACVWNGNNTAIDGCSGFTEGGCFLPGIPPQGGTIMSYCHNSSVGINLNEGFGPQPGNVIRSHVANASCTTPCSTTSCDDGIQNGDEEGVDCGGTSCPPCQADPTCDDGIQNGDETDVDCGGPDCPTCPTCDDGIQNGDEGGIDCGGPDCAPCPNCNDGILNGDEIDVDCGGSCAPCPCDHNLTLTITLDILGNQTTWDVVSQEGVVYATGGPYAFGTIGLTITENICLPDNCYTFTIYDAGNNGLCCTYGNGTYTLSNDADGSILATGSQFGSSEANSFCLNAVPNNPSCSDGIQNGDETGVDCGGAICPACPTCNDGIQNGDEEGVDCGGSDCAPCQSPPTCDDGIQNGDETGVDCGGSTCPDCPTCDDGIQNGSETGVDCGGPVCPACPPPGECGAPMSSSVEFTSNPRVIIIHWDAMPGATSYQLRYRKVGTSGWTNATSNTNSRQIFLFNPSGSYEYQIRSLCPGGWTDFSDLFNFTIGTGLVGPGDTEDIFLSTVYPNPARAEMNLELVVSVASDIEVKIYDVLGRQVYQGDYNLVSGRNNIKLNVSGLENGYHLIKILDGNQQYVESFIKN